MYKIIGGDQKEYGPVSADELRHWISEGRVNGQSQVLVEGAGEWRPLSTFPEFAEALRAQATASLPPAHEPTRPIGTQSWVAGIVAREPQIQIGQCLALSWKLLTENFGVLFGASFLIWVIGTVCAFVPFGGLLWMVFRGVLYGGLYLVFLNRIRGKPASVGDVFSGFSAAFAQLALVGLVTSLLTGVATFCCLLVPGLYLFVAWTFSVPLVADARLEFWSAMELSRKVVTRVWFELFALLVAAFLPAILTLLFVYVKIFAQTFPVLREMSASSQPDFARIISLGFQMAKANLPFIILLKVVALFNLPFAVGALMYAYENLFSTRITPTA